MEEYIDYIILGIALLINVLSAVLNSLKNIKNGKNIEDVKTEVICMKCRLPDYQEKEAVKGTSFSKYKDEYKWDEVDEKVIPTGQKIDLQALIESSADCALDKMLEKFNLDPTTLTARAPASTVSDEVADFTAEVKDDLEILSRYKQKVADVRTTYGIDSSVPDAEIFNELNKIQRAYSARLENIKKGVNANGEKTSNLETEK